MSTFLQICQDVHRILRVGDNRPGSAPTTVVGQVDELGDIVYFVNKAWLNLQMHHDDWRWMQGSVAVTLTPNVNIITVNNFLAQNDRFAHVKPFVAMSRQPYATVRDGGSSSNPSINCYYIPWLEFTGFYTRSPAPASARPMHFSEAPNRAVRLYPAPNEPTPGNAWIFSTPCRLTPQTLAADSDVPEMPAEYHDIIVWWAVDLFCRSRSNMGPLSIEAKREVNRQLSRLAADQLPEFVQWSPYA